jgi:ABC-type sugar transport system ATPase subunit
VLQEQRTFEPPAEFRRAAHIKSEEDYERIYRESVEHPEKFWTRVADELHWFKKWDKVLEWKHPWAKWFVGGEINLSYNCLDRHVQTARKNKAAIVWESEPGEVRILTYQQLLHEVEKFANVLKSFGVKKGDRVAIYMGMTPELPIAMLACARIGAPHTVIFGGFAAHALVDRIHDSQASLVVTQDGAYRRGNEVKLFPVVAESRRRQAGALSGGQQQQLAIARALVAKPDVLLLDEPSLGLAPQIVDAVFETLTTIRDRGLAILLVEQRAQRTVALADRSHVMSNGELRLTLGPDDAADTRTMVAAYFA